MTTTGGPERSLADPATNKTSADDSIAIERIADGDDIVVEPSPPRSRPRRGRRTAVGLIVAIVLVIAVAAALATRHTSHDTTTRNLRSVSQVSPPAAHPTPAGHAANPISKAVAAKPLPPKSAAPVDTTTVAVAPPATVATVTLAAPPPAPPVTSPPPAATTPPVTAPPVEPTSVLRWTATPASLTVKGGAPAGVTITVANPTKGTVTLGTPLSCAPVLRGPHGAVIGDAICEQMAQVMSPHSTLTQHFTIYATNTADASGQPLAPGVYTASFENLFKIKVNVTAS